MQPMEILHDCCDFHREQCICDDCVISSVPDLFLSSITEDHPSTDELAVSPNAQTYKLTKDQTANLCEDLILILEPPCLDLAEHVLEVPALQLV